MTELVENCLETLQDQSRSIRTLRYHLRGTKVSYYWRVVLPYRNIYEEKLVYCPVSHTLIEFGPKIRCSGVLSCYCCYGNHAACSKPVLKPQSVENWIRRLSTENNECCELVKYNISIIGGPVFFVTPCRNHLQSYCRDTLLCYWCWYLSMNCSRDTVDKMVRLWGRLQRHGDGTPRSKSGRSVQLLLAPF